MADWPGLADQAQATLVDSPLGEPLTYRTKDGEAYTETPDGRPLRGIFDEAFEEARLEGDLMVASRRPMLFVRGADLPQAPVKGDRPLIQDRDYEVCEAPRADGSGGWVLFLRRLSP